MEFQDGWSALAILIYVVGGLVCWLIAYSAWERKSRRKRIVGGWVTGILLFAIGVSMVNGISWAFTSDSLGDRSATIGEVSQSFGLKSGNEYPLVLGSRISGSTGSGYVAGAGALGFFSVYGTSSEQPASAISVSFTHSEDSYILEIPTAKITFKKSEGPSKVQLFLNASDPYDEYTEHPDAAVTYTYGACKAVVLNLWLSCVKPQVTKTVTLSAAIQRQGLAPIVAKNLDSAIITLTPEAYKKLLG